MGKTLVERKKEKALRRISKLDIEQQLTEVPDNVRVFDDFRELPDDIFDSYGDRTDWSEVG